MSYKVNCDSKTKNSLLKWMNCLKVGNEVNSIIDLRNGNHFVAVLKLSNGAVARNKLKVLNWKKSVKIYLEGYYQMNLADIVDFDAASLGDEDELAKICTYMLLTTFTGINSIVLAEMLTNLDTASQEGIQSIIESVLNNGDPHIQQKLSSSLFTIAEAFGNASASSSKSITSVGSASPIGRMLQSPINVHKVVVQDKNEVIRKLQKEILEEKNARSHYENEAMDSNRLLEQNKTEWEILNKDNHRLKSRVEMLEFEKNQFQIELDGRESTIKTLEIKLCNLKEDAMEHKRIQLLLNESETEITELKTTLEKLEDSYSKSKRGSDLLLQLEESNEDLRQKLVQKMEEVLYFKDRLKEAEFEVQKMKDISLEKQTVCPSPELPQESEQLSGIIEMELIACREQLDQVQTALENKMIEMECLITEHDETLKEVTESKIFLEQQLNEKNSEMAEFKIRSDVISNELKIMYNLQITELQNEKADLEAKWQNESSINAELTNNISDVRTELFNLRSSYEDVNNRRAYLATQLLSATETNSLQYKVLQTVLENVENHTAKMTEVEMLYDDRFEGLKKHCDNAELKIRLLSDKFIEQQNVTCQLLATNRDEQKNFERDLMTKDYEIQQRTAEIVKYQSEIENATALHKVERQQQQNTVETLEETITNFKAELEKQKFAKSTAEKNYEALMNNYESVQGDNDKLKESVTSLNAETEVIKGKLQNVIHDSESQLALQTSQLTQCRKEYEDALMLINNYKSHIDAVEVLHSNAVKMNEDNVLVFEQSLRTTKEEKDVIQKQLENLAIKMEDCEKELLRQVNNYEQIIDESNSRYTEEIQRRQGHINTLEKSLSSLKTESESVILQKDVSIECLNKQINDVTSKLENEKLAKSTAEKTYETLMVSYKLEQNENEKSMTSLSAEIEALKSKLQNIIEDSECQLAVQTSALTQTRKEREDALMLVSHYKSQIDIFELQLNETVKVHEENVFSLKQSLKTTKEEKELVQNELETLTATLEDCEKEILELSKQVKSYELLMDESNSRFTEEIQRYQDHINTLEKSLSSLNGESEAIILQKDMGIECLNKQLNDVTSELEKEKVAKSTVEKTYEVLIISYKTEQIENEMLKGSVTSLSAETATLKSELQNSFEGSERQLALQTSQLTKCRKEYEEALMQVNNYKSQIDAVELQHSEAVKSHEDRVLKLKQSLRTTKEENDLVQNQLETLTLKLEGREMEISELSKKIKSCESFMDESNLCFTEEIQRNQDHINVLEKSLLSLKAESEDIILQKDVDIECLNKQLKDVTSELENEKLAKSTVEKTYETLMISCKLEQSENEALKESINALSSETEALKSELQNVVENSERQSTLQTSELTQCRKECEDALMLVNSCKSHVDVVELQYSEAIKAHEGNVINLEQSLRTTKEEKERVQNQLEALTTKLEACEKEIPDLLQQVESYQLKAEISNSYYAEEIKKYHDRTETLEKLKDESDSVILEKNLNIEKLNKHLQVAISERESEKLIKSTTEKSHEILMNNFKSQQTDYKILKESASSLTAELIALKKKLEDGESRFSVQESALAQCRKDLENALVLVENCNSQINVNELQYRQAIKAYDESISSLELNLKTVKEEKELTQLNNDKEIQSFKNKISLMAAECANENLARNDSVNQDGLEELHRNVNSMTETIVNLRGVCKTKDTEVEEWKMKYNVLMKSNINEMYEHQSEMDDKMIEAIKQVKKEMETEILKLQEEVSNSEKKHEKAIEILTKVNHEMKDECRRRKLAEENSRAELRARDVIIDQLKQQLRSKQPTVTVSERRETFLVPKAVSSSNLMSKTISSSSLSSINQLLSKKNATSAEVLHAPSETMNLPVYKHTTYTVKEHFVDNRPESVYLSRRTGSEMDLNKEKSFNDTLSSITHTSFTNKVPDTAGWIDCEDEEGEFHNFSYLEDLKSDRDDTGRIDELQRRNTLCLPHLRTSYPLETLISGVKIKEEDIKSGSIKMRPLMATSHENIVDKEVDDLVDRRKTRVIQGSYRKPGPPTPGKSKQEAVRNKTYKTASNVAKLFSRPMTPKSYAKYKLHTPKRHNNENSPPGTFVQASPKVAAVAKKALAFNIGFSPKVKKIRATTKSVKTTSTPVQKRGQD